MKICFGRLPLALVGAVVLAVVAAAPASASAPYPKTGAATSITGSSATLNGVVGRSAEGPFGEEYFPEVVWVFQYGLTTAYGYTSEPHVIRKGGGRETNVSAPITGLSRGTTYHYGLAGVNWEKGGAAYGEDKTFTTLSNGIYLTGQPSEEPARQPELAASSYPQELTTWPYKGGFIIGLGEIAEECNIEEGSAGTMSAPITSLTITTVGVAGCSFENATLKMKGCKFTDSVANAGPPYVGTFAIECPTSPMELVVPKLECTITIGSQAFSNAIEYSEIAENSRTGELAHLKASKVAFEANGKLCWLITGFAAKHTNGTLDDEMMLLGSS